MADTTMPMCRDYSSPHGASWLHPDSYVSDCWAGTDSEYGNGLPHYSGIMPRFVTPILRQNSWKTRSRSENRFQHVRSIQRSTTVAVDDNDEISQKWSCPAEPHDLRLVMQQSLGWAGSFCWIEVIGSAEVAMLRAFWTSAASCSCSKRQRSNGSRGALETTGMRITSSSGAHGNSSDRANSRHGLAS